MLVENPVKITETQIKKMAKLARGRITTIYLHWTAGHYGQVFIGIALCCGYDATCELPTAICAKAAWSAVGPEDYRDPYEAMVDGGSEPPTEKQIEAVAKIVAILCKELDFPNSSDRVMTHCEIAFRDGYGPGSGDPETKWDLWFLPDNARNNRLCPGGCLIRGKAAYYLWDMKHKKKAA